jgi:hypothetical protein
LIFQIEQGGLLPALDRYTADVITESEHTVKAYADKDSLTLAVRAIVDLIKLSEFNADEVDTDMLKRHQAAIDRGDLQVTT